jgi:hypothetical protein
VSGAFDVAGLLAIVAALAHSYLGERYILRRLLRSPELPRLFRDPVFTARVLRLAWHATSIAWLGLGVVLLALARPAVSAAVVARIVGITFLLTAGYVLAGSRGRHLAWILFLVVGVAALFAASR